MQKNERFQNAVQILENINTWQIEMETKEEIQKSLIRENKRKEQQTTKAASQ